MHCCTMAYAILTQRRSCGPVGGLICVDHRICVEEHNVPDGVSAEGSSCKRQHSSHWNHKWWHHLLMLQDRLIERATGYERKA